MADAGAHKPGLTKPRGTPIGDAIFTLVTVLGGGLTGFLAAKDSLRGAYNGIAESPGPYAVLTSLLFGFTLAVAIVWPIRGRERVGVLLAMPPLILFVSWILGAHRLEDEVSRVTPDVELLAQVERWSIAASDGAAVWTFGAFFAAILFVSAAFAFALRGRARASVGPTPSGAPKRRTGRRVAAWIVGFVAMVGTGVGIAVFRFLPLSGSDRAPALAAVLPSALGVLCIYLAAGALRDGPRNLVARDILLSFAATTGAIVATAMMASFAEIAQASPLPLSVVVLGLEERRADSMSLFLLALPFVIAPLLAMLVVLGSPRRPWFEGTVKHALVPIAVTFLLLLGPRARAFRTFVDGSQLPRALTQLPLRGGSVDACAELVPSHLVTLGPAGVTGAVTVAARQDGTCEDAALAIDALSKDDDAYLAVDPATPFAQVGCIVDALTRLRAPRMSTASASTPREIFAGCAVRFVGRRDGKLVCKRVAFADPRCAAASSGDPDTELDIELTTPALLRWTQRDAMVKMRTFPLADLGATVQAEWKEQGQHRDPMDRQFDVATVRGNPTDSFAQTMDHFATVESVKRKIVRYGRGRMSFAGDEEEEWGERERSAFDLRLASVYARFEVASEATLPPWPTFPTTRDPKDLTAAQLAHQAALKRCAWNRCSFALEARHRAASGELDALGTTNVGRSQGIRQIQRALALDPSVTPTEVADAETAALLASAWKDARALPQPTIVFDAIDLSRVTDLTEESITTALAEVRNGLAHCTVSRYPAGDNDTQTDVSLSIRHGRVIEATAELNDGSCITSTFQRVVIPGSRVIGDVTVRIVGKFRGSKPAVTSAR